LYNLIEVLYRLLVSLQLVIDLCINEN